MDAQIRLRKEEYAHGTEAQIKRCSSKGKDCTNKAQKGGACKRHGAQINDAVAKDVLIKSSKEESALGMGQISNDQFFSTQR
eukprot:scaffold12335_cov116-Skeletonema_dohrnii-CCMP3373.AAC.3